MSCARKECEHAHMSANQQRALAGEPTALHFASKDGTKLFASYYGVDKAKGNALILHGYAEHGGRYQELAKTLNDCHMNALCVDLRGHGRSEGERGLISRFEEYLEDTEAALAQLQQQGGDKPVLLAAHSNGALIALRLLADPFRCPASIQAAVISSPFLGLKIQAPAKKIVARLASRILPKLTLPNEIKSEHLSHDPEKIREHEHDTLCHDVASARWFTEATETQAWVEEFAPRIRVPSLWVVAGMDQIAEPEQARKVNARLSAETSYHEFPEMHHEVLNELGRAQIYDLISTFVTSKFGL